MVRKTRHKEIEELNNTIKQLDLKDIFRKFQPATENSHFLLSSTYETFSRTDHMLDHKTSCRNFKGLVLYENTFSEQNRMKLEFKDWRKFREFTNIWKLHNIFLDIIESKKKSQRNLENTLRWINTEPTYHNLWDASKAVFKGKFMNANTYIEKRKKLKSIT